MMAVFETLLTTLLLILGIMIPLWILSLTRRDASIVDAFWGTGFLVVVVCAWMMNSPENHRALLLLILTAIWGVRLSLFLLWRNWGKGEDYRYAAMRAHHRARFWWVSLFTVFLLQGAILWFVSMPVQVALVMHSESPWGFFDFIGLLAWIVGLFFESVGDWQLARFKADSANAGKVMERGLWRYTRHPNYFGDFCVWWGLYFIASQGGAGWTIASPLLMSFLLLRVSGVSLLEKTIMDRRPEYSAYQRRTNAFLPGPRRSK